jgi:hypothetical protein
MVTFLYVTNQAIKELLLRMVTEPDLPEAQSVLAQTLSEVTLFETTYRLLLVQIAPDRYHHKIEQMRGNQHVKEIIHLIKAHTIDDYGPYPQHHSFGNRVVALISYMSLFSTTQNSLLRIKTDLLKLIPAFPPIINTMTIMVAAQTETLVFLHNITTNPASPGTVRTILNNTTTTILNYQIHALPKWNLNLYTPRDQGRANFFFLHWLADHHKLLLNGDTFYFTQHHERVTLHMLTNLESATDFEEANTLHIISNHLTPQKAAPATNDENAENAAAN